MRTRFIIMLIATVTVAAACGGGDDGVSGDQAEVADLFITAASDENLELDRECVETAAAKLSDDDAEKILEAGLDGDSDVSEAANAVADEMADCIPVEALLDSMVEQFESDDTVDLACLRGELEGAANATEISDRVFDALVTCSVDG